MSVPKEVYDALPSLGVLSLGEVEALKRVKARIASGSGSHSPPYVCAILSSAEAGDYNARVSLRRKIDRALRKVLHYACLVTLGRYLEQVCGVSLHSYNLTTSYKNSVDIRLAWIDKILKEQNL